MKFDVLGHHLPATGAWVIQERLRTELDAAGILVPEEQPQRLSLARRLALTPSQDADAVVFLQSPLPLRPGAARKIAVIFDLRYLRTRSGLYSGYRLWDLRRTIAVADHIATISPAVKAQLELFVDASRVSILPLGPGQFDGVDTKPSNRRKQSVLLMGGAPHKRNDLAIDCIQAAQLNGIKVDVTTVGISGDDEQRLRRILSENRLRITRNLSADELRSVMQECEVFLHCGVSEGFGFPYLESLSSGCVPICRRYAVTQDIFGSDGAYLDEDNVTESFVELLRGPYLEEKRNSMARILGDHTWGRMASHLASVL